MKKSETMYTFSQKYTTKVLVLHVFKNLELNNLVGNIEDHYLKV